MSTGESDHREILSFPFLMHLIYNNRMEDSDAHPDLSKETLAEQFDAVRERTAQSHVTQYGDASIAKLPGESWRAA